jgi:hypothetical protein
MILVDQLEKQISKQIMLRIWAIGRHILTTFPKILGKSLRNFPHPPLCLKFKGFSGSPKLP